MCEQHRSRGIGAKLMNCCLEHVGDNNCGVFMPSENIEKYRRKGFNIKSELIIQKFEGKPHNLDGLQCERENENYTVKNVIKDDHNVDYELFDKVVAYDEKVHKYNRQKYLKYRLGIESGEEITLFAAIDSNDNLVGFGCANRMLPNAVHMGPVYADDKNIGHSLIEQLIKAQMRLRPIDTLKIMTFVTCETAIEISKKLLLPKDVTLDLTYTKSDIETNDRFVYVVDCAHFNVF